MINGRVLEICLVQPIQSPYWTDRLRVLGKDERVRLTLLLERDRFDHRPGWRPEPVVGVEVFVVGSLVGNVVRVGSDLGYRIQGIRSIPWKLTFELWRRKPDVVVMCNATQVAFALPLKYLRRSRLALIVEDTPHATRNLGWLSRRVKHWLYRRVDKCFAFSSDAERFLENAGIEERKERTSWSLDMGVFCPRATRSRDEADVAGICKRVIFVGALTVSKGVRFLIDAWRELPNEVRSRSRLLLVGTGPLQTEVERSLGYHGLVEVSMYGQVPYLRVRDLMKEADLLVLPTLQDLYSLTVFEAMACGCPVITTPYNGARELVVQGKNGWIVDPTEPRALYRALAEALSPNTDLSAMGAAARQRVIGMDNEPVMNHFANSLISLANSDA